MAEITRDSASLAVQWNSSLLPLLDPIPDGSDDTLVDAFKDGLDGKTLYLDSDATSQAQTLAFYNVSRERPNTVKEQFDLVYGDIADLANSISIFVASSNGLTDDQKAAIGINIFDSDQLSSSTSLDGKSTNNELNIQQVAKDLYGSDYILNNDGVPIWTNAMMAAVSNLLDIHNGTWNGDIAVSHDADTNVSGTTTTTNDTATTVVTLNDTVAGKITNIEVKALAKTAGGKMWTLKAAWLVDVDNSIALGPDGDYALGNAGTEDWDVTLTVVTGDVNIKVVGAIGDTISWNVVVSYIVV